MKKILKHFLYNLVCVEFPVLFAEFDTERYEPKLLTVSLVQSSEFRASVCRRRAGFRSVTGYLSSRSQGQSLSCLDALGKKEQQPSNEKCLTEVKEK